MRWGARHVDYRCRLQFGTVRALTELQGSAQQKRQSPDLPGLAILVIWFSSQRGNRMLGYADFFPINSIL